METIFKALFWLALMAVQFYCSLDFYRISKRAVVRESRCLGRWMAMMTGAQGVASLWALIQVLKRGVYAGI